MRLVRLDLKRYGKFTDFSLDFGEKKTGKPDLHVVYGPNEAGKTTTFTAILDLLFGIERTTSYNFIHASEAMEIGALVETGGGLRAFRRIKKQTNGLLDGSGLPVPETAIRGDLGSLSRDDFAVKFSLDADTLEKGGENILASKGDLGALLFSASAGIADLSQKLDDTREEIDKFFKKGTRKNGLAELKGQLKDLDDRRKELDTLATRYSSLVAERQKAVDLYDRAMQERSEALSIKTEAERLESAIPSFEALASLEARLQSLANVPTVAADWKEKVTRLSKQEIAQKAELKSAVDSVRDLTHDIEAMIMDEEALALVGQIGNLQEARSRYVSAEEDLPRRRPRLAELESQIAFLLRTLGCDGEINPDDLVLTAAAASQFRTLIETWAGVETEWKNAQAEREKAQEKCDELTQRLAQAQGKGGIVDPAALALLNAVSQDIRKAGFEAACEHLSGLLLAAEQDLAEKLNRLDPWQGSVEDLAAMHVPEPAQIEAWRDAVEEAESECRGQQERVRQLAAEISELQAIGEASESIATMISDVAHQRRSEREAAWARHRGSLTKETAEAFETSLRSDDLATNALFNHATEVARGNTTRDAIASKQKNLGRAEQQLVEAKAQLTSVRVNVGQAIKAVSAGFPSSITLAEFIKWMVRYDKAIEQRDKVKIYERDLGVAEERQKAATDRLSQAMTGAGLAHTPEICLETLLLLVQIRLDEAMGMKGLHDALEDAHRDLGRRAKHFDIAQNAMGKWQGQWQAACSDCWIGEMHAEPRLALVREILAKLEELRPLLLERSSLADRIRKMEDNHAGFAQQVLALAGEMREETLGQPMLFLADRLADRIRSSSERALLRDAKLVNLKKAKEKEGECQRAIAENAAEIREVLEGLGVETLAAAMEALDDASVKADLLARRAAEETHITRALGVVSMEDATAVLQTIDQAALSSRKVVAENRFQAADERQRDLHAAKCRAEDLIDAIGGDEAVALIEEQRRTLCLEIEDKARQWLRYRAGIAAAERALRNYREKHCSSMLTNASEAFATISRGTYGRLTTRPDGKGETLVGLPATGGSRSAEEMSKGTRFQLYLALRVAGYREYANARQPPSAVPFIADDIMETYDDLRAEEAFRLLSGMAEIGQVIYLTHHEHLLAIVQSVCPGVKIHRLTG